MAYGFLCFLAFWSSRDKTKIASKVLLPFLKPNCSSPNIPCFSTMAVILEHIRVVINLRMFEGTVIGLYWLGFKESPP